jgi:hypothetical protein
MDALVVGCQTLGSFTGGRSSAIEDEDAFGSGCFPGKRGHGFAERVGVARGDHHDREVAWRHRTVDED